MRSTRARYLSGYRRVDRGPWGYFGYPASIAALTSFHLSVAVLNLCMNNGAARSGSVLSHIASNNLETRLFTSSADPVGAGLVASLGRPSGNATGFSSFEYSIGGKWLELLKQIAPTVTRVAVVRDPNVPAGIGQFGAIQAVAPYVGVELRPIDTRDSSEIEQAMNAHASNRRWTDRDAKYVGALSSQADHCARCEA